MYTHTEKEQMRNEDICKNKMVRLGMMLLFIGFLLQLAALLM